jgi:hypothetical protein
MLILVLRTINTTHFLEPQVISADVESILRAVWTTDLGEFFTQGKGEFQETPAMLVSLLDPVPVETLRRA